MGFTICSINKLHTLQLLHGDDLTLPVRDELSVYLICK